MNPGSVNPGAADPGAASNSTGLGRRDLFRVTGLIGLAAALPAGLAGCGRGFGGGSDDSEGGDQVTLTMVWWGDAKRAEKTQKALDLFSAKYPKITVKTEYQDSSPYKDKLATRFAAGDPPDLLAMRVDSLREYADRGSLLDLGKHLDQLDLDGLSDSARRLGAVGDKNFGVPSGLNAIGFVVNRTLTDRYGIAVPNGDTWSWGELATFARQLTAASGRKVYGTLFEPATLANLIVYTRQQGEDFYTADGRIGMSEATLTGWFSMIESMRAEGGFPPGRRPSSPTWPRARWPPRSSRPTTSWPTTRRPGATWPCYGCPARPRPSGAASRWTPRRCGRSRRSPSIRRRPCDCSIS